jgi:hypothetical protein
LWLLPFSGDEFNDISFKLTVSPSPSRFRL